VQSGDKVRKIQESEWWIEVNGGKRRQDDSRSASSGHEERHVRLVKKSQRAHSWC